MGTIGRVSATASYLVWLPGVPMELVVYNMYENDWVMIWVIPRNGRDGGVVGPLDNIVSYKLKYSNASHDCDCRMQMRLLLWWLNVRLERRLPTCVMLVTIS